MLREGRLVAFPTETVYGLGADARDDTAIKSIYEAKGRPQDNPLIVHVHDVTAASRIALDMPDIAIALLKRFAPGPVTVVVNRGEGVTPRVSAGLPTVAVRIPAHPVARELLRIAAIPIAAPSANLSGRPSPTRWEAVRDDLGGRIDAILKSGASEVGLESTVVDCTGPVPVVLRIGAVTMEELRASHPDILSHGGRPEASPGTRHPHYAPNAKVVLIDVPAPAATAGYIGYDAPDPGYALERVVGGPKEYARALYDFFRTCDDLGLDRIECLRPREEGLGLALLDRISRAGGRVSPAREGSVDS